MTKINRSLIQKLEALKPHIGEDGVSREAAGYMDAVDDCINIVRQSEISETGTATRAAGVAETVPQPSAGEVAGEAAGYSLTSPARNQQPDEKTVAIMAWGKWWKDNKPLLEQPNGGDGATGFYAGWDAAMAIKREISVGDARLLEWAYLMIENSCPHVLMETVEGKLFDKRYKEIEGEKP